VDLAGCYVSLTVGLCLLRFLEGAWADIAMSGALGADAKRTDSGTMATYLLNLLPVLDIDGDGATDPATDGVLILRYMFGLRGAALVQDATSIKASRDAAAIETWLQQLMP
jgi:hypothetical protein